MNASPPIHLVIVQPKIAGNIGALARLAAATGAHLHICGSDLFDPRDKRMRRSGLDYWAGAHVFFHRELSRCLELLQVAPFLVEVGGTDPHWNAHLNQGTVCVFGPEDGSLSQSGFKKTKGLLTIPMSKHVRSLNLAQSAAILTFEALRQQAS